MEYITERKAIAKAMNDENNRVITIVCKDSEKDPNFSIIRGGTILVCTHQYQGKDAFEDADINIFRNTYHGDGKAHVNIGNGGMMIKAEFGLSDVLEMADRHNRVKVWKGDAIVFVLVNESRTKGFVIKTFAKSVTSFCQTSLRLEDGASESIAHIAWKLADNK